MSFSNRPVFRHVQLMLLSLLMAVLLTGCKAVHVYRTVGLAGLPPVTDTNQVKLVPRGAPVNQPYQTVGTISISYSKPYRYSKLSLDYSDRRFKEVAAGMGADGVIGIYETWTAGFIRFARRGLAVKWLASDEARGPVTTPFVVRLLPFRDKQAATGDTISPGIADLAAFASEPLEDKGYWVLPIQQPLYRRGLDEAKKLSGAGLEMLFGSDAHLLLEVARVDQSNYGVGETAKIKMQLMNLTTRTNVFESTASGWEFLSNDMYDHDSMRLRVAARGIARSLESLKPICERVPK